MQRVETEGWALPDRLPDGRRDRGWHHVNVVPSRQATVWNEESMSARRRHLVCLLLCLGMHACDDGSDPVGDGSLARWVLDPTPRMELGEFDGEPEEVFSRISGVGLLGDGGVVVGNAASGTLRVFDARGVFELELGGEGEGPGEFAYLAHVRVLDGDTILAYDPVAYRLSLFTRSGQTHATVQMDATNGAPEVYFGRDGRGQHLVALIRPEPRDPTEVTADVMELRRYGADGAVWESLGTFPGMRRMRSPVPLSPHLIGAVLGDTVFVTDGLSAQVRAIAPAGASSRIVDGAEVVWTPSEARQRLEDHIDDPAVAQRLQDAGVATVWDSVPHFSDALPDPGGHLWLKRYDPATDSHWVSRRRSGGLWIVATTDGVPVAEVVMPDSFRLMAVGPDRVAGVHTDELGVERVVVYSLQRVGGAA